ncbi:MAG: PilZ domain-containing protein [bacterium]|nr:PilZ domain-containing protein [bacterium]
MNTETSPFDRRQYFRFDLSGFDDKAVLRTSQGDRLVGMLEESAGGFAVFCEDPIRLKMGQILSMAYKNGCSEVVVIHCSEEEDGVRIGLRRSKELKFLHSDGWFGLFSWREMNSRKGILVATLLFIGVLAGGFLWGAGLSEDSKPQWSALLKGQWREQEPQTEALSPEEIEQQIALQLTLLSALSGGDWTHELSVSPQQKANIDQIVQATSHELHTIYRDRKQLDDPTTWSTAGMDVIRKSLSQIDTVLTDDQQQKWREMRTKIVANQVAG